MILKNNPLGASRPREWHGIFSAASSVAIASPACYGVNTAITEITWGQTFVPHGTTGQTGMRIEIFTRAIDPTIMGDTGLTTITFKCPWRADYVVTITSEIPSTDWLIQADNLALTGGCNNFTITFTELRFYIGGILQVTIAAQTDTGSSYDPRLNVFHQERHSFISGTSPGPPSNISHVQCPSTGHFADQLAFDLESSGGIKCGWRDDYGSGWVYADIAIILPPYPDDTICACSGINLNGIQYTNSWDIQIASLWHQKNTVTDLGIVTTPCSGGAQIQPKITHDWKVDEEWDYLDISITVARKDCDIKIHSESALLLCDGLTFSSGRNPVLDTYCHSNLTYATEHERATIYCQQLIQACICAFPGTCDHNLPNDVWCFESLGLIVGWPTKPPCAGSARGYDVSGALFHARTQALLNGNLSVGLADNLNNIWNDWDTGTVANWGRPRFVLAQGARLGVFYGDGTNCYYANFKEDTATLVNIISMAGGVTGDFDVAPFTQLWFFKTVLNSGVYDVYFKSMDNIGNVLVNWTITNITGIDNQWIACRSSYLSGSFRMGLYFSNGGVNFVKFAPDGLNFV